MQSINKNKNNINKKKQDDYLIEKNNNTKIRIVINYH